MTDVLEGAEEFETVKLNPERGEYFAKRSPDEIALYVAAIKQDYSDAFMGFELLKKHGKKGSEFNFAFDDESRTLSCSISGKFVLPLRPGAQDYLTGGVKFAIQGLCYKGGSYRGFMACVKGQKESEHKDWLIIDDANIRIARKLTSYEMQIKLSKNWIG